MFTRLNKRINRDILREYLLQRKDTRLLTTASSTQNCEFSVVLLSYVCRCERYKMYLRVHLQCTIILSDFIETGIFLTDLNKGPQYNISQKNLSVGKRVVPDGLPDLTKVIITFRIFADALNNTK